MPGPKPKLGNLVLNLNVNCHEDGICIWYGFFPIILDIKCVECNYAFLFESL